MASGLPPLADEPQGEFFEYAEERAIPISMHWDLIWRCNHNCIHCYLTKRQQPLLSLDESLRVLDQLAEVGCFSLLFSGGEPFLRTEILEILQGARERAFDFRINSNGTLINERIADALQELGPSRVSLSLYAAEAEIHDAVTQTPGSYALTLAAAQRLLKRGIRVHLKTPLMSINRLAYPGVEALAQSLGASWELDAHLLPDDSDDFSLCELGAQEEERLLAVMKILEPRRAEIYPGLKLPKQPEDRRVCSAGNSSGYISPEGLLSPCINWRLPLGSLREQEFSSIWYGSSEAARLRALRRRDFQEECGECSFKDQCSYCPGLSRAQTGEDNALSAYVCQRTHLIMEGVEQMKALYPDQPLPSPKASMGEWVQIREPRQG